MTSKYLMMPAKPCPVWLIGDPLFDNIPHGPACSSVKWDDGRWRYEFTQWPFEAELAGEIETVIRHMEGIAT